MWEMNVESSILAASLASKYLKADGLCVFVGAKAVAVHPTPDMLAYAMAKSAVASLATNLSINSPFSVTLLLPYKTFKNFSHLLSFLLPFFSEVLDTEANRKSMPTADTSKWTPVHLIAEKVAEFLKEPKENVNGKSWLITTRAGETKFTIYQ
mgnify:CR=1 FL=1